MDHTGMDIERCVIGELLALKDAPDDELLDQVEVIGERTARHMLFDEATPGYSIAIGQRRRTAPLWLTASKR